MINNMENKKRYTAPQLTVVTFKTEQGYAASLLESMMFWQSGDSEQVESYQQHETWNDGNGFWN